VIAEAAQAGHLNSQALPIELSTLQPDSWFRAGHPSEGEVCKHILMQTLARPPYASFTVYLGDSRRFWSPMWNASAADDIARNFTRASQITILPRFSIQLLYDTPRPVVAPLTYMKNGTIDAHAAVGRPRAL
jgi:hypothetical protein